MFARGAARAARRVAGTSGKSLAPIRRPVSRAAHGINRGIAGGMASTAGLRSAGGAKLSSARQAMAGKHVSRYVAGGAVGAYAIGGAVRSRPAADKPRGRPTGMYQY